MHEFVRHYAKETLSQFQTAAAELSQAMKPEQLTVERMPQPSYQEQFSLHRAETASTQALHEADQTQAATTAVSTELLTEFNASRPNSVDYSRRPQPVSDPERLNNALKSYLAPLREQTEAVENTAERQAESEVDEFPPELP